MPILPIDPVSLPVLSSTRGGLWDVLCDLAEQHEQDWVLVGGQMVLLHALQARTTPPRVSQDLDTIIDARVRPPVLKRFLDSLDALGFAPAGVSPDDVAHRFTRGDVRIDVLAPEGLRRRASIQTVGTASTVEIEVGLRR